MPALPAAPVRTVLTHMRVCLALAVQADEARRKGAAEAADMAMAMALFEAEERETTLRLQQEQEDAMMALALG